MKVTDDAIRSWRLSIDAANIQLGEFNWPMVLGAALDEIEGLRASLTAAEDAVKRMYDRWIACFEAARKAEAERDAALAAGSGVTP